MPLEKKCLDLDLADLARRSERKTSAVIHRRGKTARGRRCKTTDTGCQRLLFGADPIVDDAVQADGELDGEANKGPFKEAARQAHGPVVDLR